MSRIRAVVVVASLLVAASSCGGGLGSGSQSHQGPSPVGTFTTVAVTPSTATIYAGMSVQFHAQVAGQSNQTVVWSVENGAPGTIDGTGLYTAPFEANGGGFFRVIATSQANSLASGSAGVTILASQVVIAPASVTLPQGGTQTFNAIAKGLANTNVTWKVQEPGGGSVSNAGFYNAPEATGFYHVIATSVADAAFSGSTTITVTTSSGRFIPTGDMQTGRGSHTATLLANGKVLMAGGATNELDRLCFGGMASAELYDPVTGSFSGTGNMTSRRYAHTATSLLNGEVLVTGGFGSGFDCEDLGTPILSSAELYNPSTGLFRATGGMTEVRETHTATLLANSKVLVAGGVNALGVGSKTAELFNPATGGFSSTGSMATPRFGHTATLLANGKVLIAGGIDTTDPNSRVATAKAEIYDRSTGAFTPANNMALPRVGHTATLLASGRVLIAGGSTVDGSNSASAEIYDPTTSSFVTTGPMKQNDGRHGSRTGRTFSNAFEQWEGACCRGWALLPLATAELYK